MPLKIVRNDITRMDTDAIVNTAGEVPVVGAGCDTAVHNAAGYEELLQYRIDHIGKRPEGDVFITPGFRLKAQYIIHAVSPFYIDGKSGEETKLRACYRNSLKMAREHGIRSIAFPVISTGSFGYPREEGVRIAVDEINAFLLNNEMLVYLVVFDDSSTQLGKRLDAALESYIDRNYVRKRIREEYLDEARPFREESPESGGSIFRREVSRRKDGPDRDRKEEVFLTEAFAERHESRLSERMKHLEDSFSEYLLYLIAEKHLDNAAVYKNAIVDKKVFSKIKNHPDYHPQKMTALCLCIGARLNLDETTDLLARAGYALSPCDKTDIIFSYFIENGIYDMIELDIQLEEHGLPCIIR